MDRAFQQAGEGHTERAGAADLKEVSTDKLFDILLKYIGKLREEEMAIKFKERGALENITGIRRNWEG